MNVYFDEETMELLEKLIDVAKKCNYGITFLDTYVESGIPEELNKYADEALWKKIEHKYKVEESTTFINKIYFSLVDKVEGRVVGDLAHERISSTFLLTRRAFKSCDREVEKFIQKNITTNIDIKKNQHIISFYRTPTIIQGFKKQLVERNKFELEPQTTDYRIANDKDIIIYFADLVCSYLNEPSITDK